MTDTLERNFGLDIVRVTETAALHAGRWMGLGNREKADSIASQNVVTALNSLTMAGYIVIGEEAKSGKYSPLNSGKRVGNGKGPEMDVVVDPIDGTNLLIHGRTGAISVLGVAPRGSMWSPTPAAYMEKIVVDREVAPALVPECLDAPAAWTLALVARAKRMEVRDLVVFVLDRPRHADLVEEIRQAGARVALRRDGDIAGAVLAALPNSGFDVLMGVGGAPECVISTCAVNILNGAILTRLAPQSEEERQAVETAGLDTTRIFSGKELVRGDEIFFAATGVTDGPLLEGVRYRRGIAETHSLIMRAETGTVRHVRTEHAPKS